MDLVDEGVGDSAEAEATGEKGRVGLHVFEGFGGGGEDFVDFMAAEGGGEVTGEDTLVLQLVVSRTIHRIEWLKSRAVHVGSSGPDNCYEPSLTPERVSWAGRADRHTLAGFEVKFFAIRRHVAACVGMVES